jgi:hypothetical protein
MSLVGRLLTWTGPNCFCYDQRCIGIDIASGNEITGVVCVRKRHPIAMSDVLDNVYARCERHWRTSMDARDLLLRLISVCRTHLMYSDHASSERRRLLATQYILGVLCLSDWLNLLKVREKRRRAARIASVGPLTCKRIYSN